MPISLVHTKASINIQFKLPDKLPKIRQISNTIDSQLKNAAFTFGDENILEGLNVLQPGQMIVFDTANNHYKSISNFRFLYSNLDSKVSRDLKSFDDSVMNSLKRVYEKKKPRYVIPLSGGFDSRYIASICKRLGMDETLTFTYGLKYGSEAKISKHIASKLGLRWEFIQYSREDLNNAQQDLNEYSRAKFLGDSLPHYQDFLAVKLGKQKKMFEENDIFMPGHSADMLLGGHIPPFFLGREKEFSIKDVSKELNKNLCTFHNSDMSEIINQQLQSEYKSRDLSLNRNEAINLYMMWNFTNRQSKFIINSVRVYEYFGFNWYLPLWEKKYTNIAMSLSLKELENCNAWQQHCIETFQDESGEYNDINGEKNNTMHKIMEYSPLKKIINLNIFNNIKKLRKIVFSPLGLFHLLNGCEKLRIIFGSTTQSILYERLIKYFRN